jgi:hypothetical protein
VVELLTIFFKTIHGTEIVPLAVQFSNDGIFVGDVYPTDRVAVCLRGRTIPGIRLFKRLFGGGKREKYSIADIQ